MSRERLRIIGILIVGVVLGGVIVFLLVDDDDGGNGGPGQATPTTTEIERPDPEVNPTATELYDIVTGSADLAFHATYEVTVAAQPDQVTTLDVWQKDGKVRQEAVVSGNETRVAIISDGDRVVICQQPAGGRYTCGLVNDEQQTSLEAIRTGLLSQLGGQEVSATDEEIDGRAVRCFTVAVQAAGELCATAEGILVRIVSDEGTFTLVDLSREVNDDVFTPPATPGAAGV